MKTILALAAAGSLLAAPAMAQRSLDSRGPMETGTVIQLEAFTVELDCDRATRHSTGVSAKRRKDKDSGSSPS